jgi:hypothetical protein
MSAISLQSYGLKRLICRSLDFGKPLLYLEIGCRVSGNYSVELTAS